MKVIRWIFIVFFGVTALGIVAVGVSFYQHEKNKDYWDDRVRELCAKDGGVTVFERVEVSKKDYPSLKLTTSGAVILPFEDHGKSDSPFFLKDKVEIIQNGSPYVFRFEQSIIRVEDGKKLSKHVSYGRRGGDFVSLHPSSFMCGNDENNLELLTSVITVKGE